MFGELKNPLLYKNIVIPIIGPIPNINRINLAEFFVWPKSWFFLFDWARIFFEFFLFFMRNILLHNIFKAAQLDIDIPDRFGKNYKPKEWFLISLDVIQEAVDRLKDGSIEDYIFNKETGLLEKI